MEQGHEMSSMSWGRFAAMIATSTFIMFVAPRMGVRPAKITTSSPRLTSIRNIRRRVC